MKYKNILLLLPNCNWIATDTRTTWNTHPYAMCLMASILKKDYGVSIIDANFYNISRDKLKEIIEGSKPDVVGISVMTDEYAEIGRMAARLVKEVSHDILTVLGGVYASTQWENINDDGVDFIFKGEGEYVFKELLDMLNGRIPLLKQGKLLSNKYGKKVVMAPIIQNLDEVPPPSYELINYGDYTLSAPRESIDGPIEYPYGRLVTSRGCPINCVFCQVKQISGRRYRPRSPENVIGEIEFLMERYGVKSLLFDDDNFLLDKKRAADIFRLMIKKKFNLKWKTIQSATYRLDENLLDLMKESGCEYLNLAIESGVKRVLKDIINKPLDLDHAKKMVQYVKKIGIDVSVNFIIGFPGETWNEIRRTINFAESMGADYVKINFANPLPGSRLYDIAKEGRYIISEDPKSWWFMGRIKTDEFSPVELAILKAFEWDRINFKTDRQKEKIAKLMKISTERLEEIRRGTIKKTLELVKDYCSNNAERKKPDK